MAAVMLIRSHANPSRHSPLWIGRDEGQPPDSSGVCSSAIADRIHGRAPSQRQRDCVAQLENSVVRWRDVACAWLLATATAAALLE